MAKRLLVLILMGTGLALAVQGANKRTTQGDYVYLQNGTGVRISIETYRSKAGWTPVIVSMAGAEVSAVMDSKGRVVPEWTKGRDKRGLALFAIELDKGRIMLGHEAHAIVIYEQNPVRLRFRLADGVIPLPVQMDQTGKNGKLRFGGLEIPAQVSEEDHAALVQIFTPQEMKTGSGAIRPTVLAETRLTGLASPPPISRGFGARALLTPSRLRARVK